MNQEMRDRKTRKMASRLRLAVLAVILAVSTVLGLMHQFWPASRVVGVDALCPFGGIEAFYTLAASGTIMSKVATSSFLLLIGVMVLAVVARRSFCGQICPLGFLQELFGKVGGRLFKHGRPALPDMLDKPSRLLKYALLAVIVVMTAYTTALWYRPYDPWATYHHLLSEELFSGFLIGLVVLIGMLAGSVVYDRFFCRYLCPMGAFLALLSPLAWFKVRRDALVCIDCKACDKACPVSINVSEASTVDSPECINCNACVAACPIKDALSVKGKKGKAIKPAAATIVAVGIMAVIAGGTTAAGWFGWTTPTLTETAKARGRFDPADIKGKSTFIEVSQASGIPAGVFKSQFRLSDKDMKAELKTFEDKGAGPDDVRAFVEEYMKTGRAPAAGEVAEETKKPVFDTAAIKGSTTPRQQPRCPAFRWRRFKRNSVSPTAKRIRRLRTLKTSSVSRNWMNSEALSGAA